MGRNLVLAIAALLATLGTVEVGLRAVSFTELVAGEPVGTWRWIRYDPVLGHANVPGLRIPELGVEINGLGLRGPEVPRTKRPGVVRVVCLGDSTTFGIWVDHPGDLRANAPYPAEVERLARADGLAVEVVNAGVLGHSSSEGIVQLLTQILPLDPDVVTIRFGNNDHAQMVIGDLTPLATRWEYPVLRAMPALAWRSETVRLVFHAYRSLVARRRQWPQPQRVPPERFEENLRRFVAIARERGIHLAFIDFPYREIDRGPSPGEKFPSFLQAATSLEDLHAVHDTYQAIVIRVADETGTPLVRTRGPLRAFPEPTFSDYDLSHPNAAGYGVIAHELYAELRRLGWLGAPVGR